MTTSVKPCVKESLLASPYIFTKVLHRPGSSVKWLQQSGDFLWDAKPDQCFHIQTQNAMFTSGPPLVVVWLTSSHLIA
jgi:hypothetical protein